MRAAMQAVGVAAGLALVGCGPTLGAVDSPHMARFHAVASEFCAAQAADDPERLAALFTPELGEALLAAVQAGAASPLSPSLSSLLASRPGSGDCQAGRAAYWGGSRHFIELRYAGYSDALDFWLSDDGRISDLQYGKRGGGLRQALGLRVGSVKPDGLFSRRD